jgi:hypothetical protein
VACLLKARIVKSAVASTVTQSHNHDRHECHNTGNVGNSVRYEVFMVVTMKNSIFWDVTNVALVRTDVLREHITSILRVPRIGEVGTLAVTSN